MHYLDRPLLAYNDEHALSLLQNSFFVIYLHNSFKWPPFFVGKKKNKSYTVIKISSMYMFINSTNLNTDLKISKACSNVDKIYM